MPPEISNQPPSTPTASSENRLHAAAVGTLGVLFVSALFMAYAYLDTTALPPQQIVAAASATSAFDAISIIGRGAIAIDLNTGRVLYERNADEPLPLASLTKVALVLASAEALHSDSILKIPADTSYTEGGQRLLKGQVLTVRDIRHFTLVASSNDGAEILASNAEDSLRAQYASSTPGAATLWRMNDIARALNLASTRFLNVSGLDIDENSAGAYGSARDMAKLFAYAATSHPELFDGTTRDNVLLVDGSGSMTTAFNTNQVLGEIPGLIMGKTGFTDLAGGNLAIVFDAGLAQPIVAVVLGSTLDGRFSDMRAIVDAARVAITLP